MKLELAVTLPGAAEPTPVTVDIDALSEEERTQAVLLAGPEAMATLARGWHPDAARALVYVALLKAGAEWFPFDRFDIDWGFDEPEFSGVAAAMDRDPELEETIPMEPAQ